MTSYRPCATTDQGRPAPAAPPPSPGPFACRECGRAFARQEHLSRHLLGRHTKERPFRCAACNKRFSRLDSLQRHRAAVHATTDHAQNENQQPQPISDRACVKCAASRVRCTKTLRCRRCVQKGLLCEYPPGAASSTASNDTPSSTVSGRPNELGNHPGIVVPAEQPEMTAPETLTTSPVDMEWLHSPTNSWGCDITQRPFTTQPPYSMEGMQFNSTVNWMSPSAGDPFDLNFDFLSSYNVGGVNALGMPIQLSYVNNDSTAVATGDLSTAQAFMDISPDAPRRQPSFIGTGFDGYGISSPQNNPHISPLGDAEPSESEIQTVQPPARVGTYYVDGAGARAPFKGQSRNRKFSLTGETSPPGPEVAALSSDPFPAGLSKACETWIREASFATLIARIRVECDSERLPLSPGVGAISFAQFKSFVLQYFLKFHPVFSFLQKTSRCIPWFLCLAVTTIGAMHGAPKGDYLMGGDLLRILQRVAHRRLEELLDQVIATTHGTQATNVLEDENLATIQGVILTTLAVLHHGNPGSVKDTMLLWMRLVQIIQLMGVYSHFGELGEYTTVSQWIARESKARTMLMLWFTDMVFSYERCCKPMMCFTDVTSLPLPVFDDSWDEPSEHQVLWANTRQVNISQAMEMLYMEKRLPQHIGEFGTVLLIQGVCRRSYDALRERQSQLLTWNPTSAIQARQDPREFQESWPPTDELSARWRNSACDCLDILHWSANSKIARSSGWEHPTVLQLHLARLVLLTPSKHLDTIATVGLDSSSQDRLSEASSHILHWAIRDRYKARLSVIHAGALFWHVRRYSSGSMLEPYAVYLATLVLWAYSNATRASKRRDDQAVSRATAKCAVPQQAAPDSMDNAEPSEARTGPESTGTPSPESLELDDELTFIHLDRPLDDEAVQTFVRLGDKITGNLLRVGDISSPGAPRAILAEGIHLLVGGDEGRRPTMREFPVSGGRAVPNHQHSTPTNVIHHEAWGVSHTYAASLRRLKETATSATRVGT